MLKLEGIVSGYGSDPVLRGISLAVPDRTIVAVLGHNGAGKSSLVRVLIGLIPAWEGSIRLDGREISASPSPHRVRSGLAVSFQDEPVFPTLSVETNLRLGGHVHERRKAWIAGRAEQVLDLFPQLKARLKQPAYTLSGGERRMLSIGMALMTDPKLIILDEPSTGLSPRIAEQVFGIVADIRDRLGKAVLIVEQNVEQALALADRAVVLKTGTVIYEGTAAALRSDSTELVMMF